LLIVQEETDLSGGSDVRSLRSAFVEVHEELEAKFPDYEMQSKEHSRIAQVHAVIVAVCWPTNLTYIAAGASDSIITIYVCNI